MLSHGQHERDMKAKGWNDQQMVTFSTSLLDIIKKIVQTASTPNCLISRWFDFIFNFIIPSLSATRFVDYARMSRTLSNLKMSGTIPRDKLMIAGLYNEAMAPWRNTEVDLHYPHYFEAEEIRDEVSCLCVLCF